MNIAKHAVVSIHYTLKDGAGAVIDSSAGNEPLADLHGIGNLVPGLETALEGKGKGEKLDVTVAPAEGYGPRDDKLVQKVPKRMFEGGVEVGMRFHAGPSVVTVTHIIGDMVTIDANHPLAGQDLHFSVEVMDVRAASEEELEHGHVHGAGGHHH
jgi:FKBP-type peptidyl-prolyl cis-trans isomerase SlyD